MKPRAPWNRAKRGWYVTFENGLSEALTALLVLAWVAMGVYGLLRLIGV